MPIVKDPNAAPAQRLPARPLRVVNVADVERVPTRFLWYPYIPAGKLTVIEGDPSIGKSWLSCAISKAVAGGDPLPGMSKERKLRPQKVLLVSAEDGIADTLAPRLDAMGANTKNIDFVTEGFYLDTEGVRQLEETLRSRAITIVFIDPIVAYLGSKMDMNRANEVRDVMHGLASAAERTGCAVVAIRHLRKASSDNALYRGIGSIDFTAAARSVISCSWSKDGKTRLFRHIKCNVAPLGRVLAYDILKGEEIVVEGPDGENNTTNIWTNGGFEWIEGFEELESETHEPKVSQRPLAQAQAEDFLIAYLSQGPKPAMEVIKAAQAAGITERTLKRAKRGLAKSTNNGDIWLWELIPRLPNEGIASDA
jgi:hypothetical protein